MKEKAIRKTELDETSVYFQCGGLLGRRHLVHPRYPKGSVVKVQWAHVHQEGRPSTSPGGKLCFIPGWTKSGG